MFKFDSRECDHALQLGLGHKLENSIERFPILQGNINFVFPGKIFFPHHITVKFFGIPTLIFPHSARADEILPPKCSELILHSNLPQDFPLFLLLLKFCLRMKRLFPLVLSSVLRKNIIVLRLISINSIHCFEFSSLFCD